jgi:uncharacterized protein with HEPN domain
MYKSSIEIIRHIYIEAKYIAESSENKSFDDLCNDETWKRAIIRSLEIIGEASKKIDAETKDKFFFIKWREMAKMRDKLIHDYFGVDYEIVWDVISNRIPELYHQLNEILSEEDGNR